MHLSLRPRSFSALKWVFPAVLLLGANALRAQESLTYFQMQELITEADPIIRKGVSFGTNRISFRTFDNASAAVDADKLSVYITPPDKSYTIKARFFLEEVVSTNLQATFEAKAKAQHADDTLYFTGTVFAGLGEGFRCDFTRPVPPPGVPMNESVVYAPFSKGYVELSLRAPAPKLQELHQTWAGVAGSLRFEPELKLIPAK